MNTGPASTQVLALNEISATIQPGDIKQIDFAGGFVLVEAASSPFQIKFDSGIFLTCKQGFTFAQGFAKIILYNNQSNAITVDLFVGSAGVGFIGSTNFQEAPTYNKGNLGCQSAANVTALTTGTITGYSRFDSQGTGYNVGDLLTVPGGTASPAASFTVTGVDSSGRCTSLSVANGGVYTVMPTLNNVALTGGTGTGVTVNLKANPSVTGLSYDATNNCLIVAPASDVLVNNFDGANRRKQIIFQVLNILTGGQPSSSLVVSDPNGNILQRIAPGQVIGVDNSGPLYLNSLGEGAGSNNCEFLTWEVYYST